ncbi:MAG: hypothetical protein QOD53_425 [Thermoleophilaceae bacterium]|jgi:hypothetical protein|nr:hypothetical protein [Thermoleophilaceae bacterium]
MTRRHAYWWVAAVVMPLVNPVALVLIGREPASRPVLVAAEVGLLWWLATRAWPEAKQRRLKLLVGVVVATVLTVAFGIAEFVVFLFIACSNGGCFS